jgi:hypothetical protein
MRFEIEEIEMISPISTEPVIAQEVNTAVHHNVRDPYHDCHSCHIINLLILIILIFTLLSSGEV